MAFGNEYWVSYSFECGGYIYKGTEIISTTTPLSYNKIALKTILTKLMILHGISVEKHINKISSFIVYDIRKINELI